MNQVKLEMYRNAVRGYTWLYVSLSSLALAIILVAGVPLWIAFLIGAVLTIGVAMWCYYLTREITQMDRRMFLGTMLLGVTELLVSLVFKLALLPVWVAVLMYLSYMVAAYKFLMSTTRDRTTNER